MSTDFPEPAGPESPETVRAHSHLTLHYRLSLLEQGADVVSTFGGRPATFQLGQGHLAEPLEQCLMGLAEGVQASFDLDPAQAFGPRNPELLQHVPRSLLDEHGGGADGSETYAPGDLVDFPGPDGMRYAGVLKEIDDQWALFDFNHPLAGQRLRFEVQIIGVLQA